jgi:hypothetical protein
VTNNNVPVTIFPQKDFICDGKPTHRTGRVQPDAVHQQKKPDQKVSPSIYAALIDSLFQIPAPLLRAPLVAVAAAMTALKTEVNLLWACVAFLS